LTTFVSSSRPSRGNTINWPPTLKFLADINFETDCPAERVLRPRRRDLAGFGDEAHSGRV
jgi:hypothetical protein